MAQKGFWWLVGDHRPPTNHLLYWPPTKHLLTTYCAVLTTYRPPTNHLPTTYWPPTNHLPTTYWLPTDHLRTTYWPPTDYLPTTYWPPTDYLPTTYEPLLYGAACSIFLLFLLSGFPRWVPLEDTELVPSELCRPSSQRQHQEHHHCIDWQACSFCQPGRWRHPQWREIVWRYVRASFICCASKKFKVFLPWPLFPLAHYVPGKMSFSTAQSPLHSPKKQQ